jgi:phosphate transport system permease protein
MDNRSREIINRRIRKRYAAERRFKLYGMLSVGFGLVCLAVLFTDIVTKGLPAFQQTWLRMDIVFDSEYLQISDANDPDQLKRANFDGLFREQLRAAFPGYSSRSDRRSLYAVFSSEAGYQLQRHLRSNPEQLDQEISIWLIADDDTDMFMKYGIDAEDDATRLSDIGKSVVRQLKASRDVESRFNTMFFTQSDSREPELAGIRGALLGSFYTLLVTLCFAFPIGVAAAIYLEEFGPRNRMTDLIEVNINNLAAVPSVIFGLLGLAVFINIFGIPRSVPLVGGLVLALMTLPTIIISSRSAIMAVPPSIKEAALGIGASKVQTVMHHVLPLAMPGILTGTIIGMARALGETAPLLMIGMVAFIIDPPSRILDPATALPVQIYLWADSPERAFVARTSAAIMVLLGFLVLMNGTAVYLRKRLETRW